ncbi:hypothetical protein SAMN05216498_2087 [Tenuibacillus multivorans]|uniref:Uncharacterized protein n=1 Tax=Tenuibacillus multivorans TaxID=237069 RepID=A0A1H0AV44_9BACI|nr:hypothetical protein SAMN05216498_2087 [Tenuibacillus multivorans]
MGPNKTFILVNMFENAYKYIRLENLLWTKGV